MNVHFQAIFLLYTQLQKAADCLRHTMLSAKCITIIRKIIIHSIQLISYKFQGDTAVMIKRIYNTFLCRSVFVYDLFFRHILWKNPLHDLIIHFQISFSLDICLNLLNFILGDMIFLYFIIQELLPLFLYS